MDLHKASHAFHMEGQSALQEKCYKCLGFQIATAVPSDTESASLLNGQWGSNDSPSPAHTRYGLLLLTPKNPLTS